MYHRAVSEKPKPKRSPVIEISLVILILIIFWAILAPVRAGGGPAYRTQGLSNVKQASLGVIMYSSDYDDIVPYVTTSEQLIGVTREYIKNDDVWDTRNDQKSGKWQLNMCLAGAKTTDIDNPTEVPGLYDAYGRKPKDRPNEPWMFTMAFVDGHGKNMNEAQWKEATKFFSLKLKKYGKPLGP